MLAIVLPCCMAEPPGPDEILCGWEFIQTVEAEPDRCARFLASASSRIGADACEARNSETTCVILQPGESARVYADPYSDDVPRLTHGSCEKLACP